MGVSVTLQQNFEGKLWELITFESTNGHLPFAAMKGSTCRCLGLIVIVINTVCAVDVRYEPTWESLVSFPSGL